MPRTCRSAPAGFTYIGLLFAVAILGITLGAVGVVWSTQIRRDKEAELLFVGDQIRQGDRPLRGERRPAIPESLETWSKTSARRLPRHLSAPDLSGSDDQQS